MAAQKRLLIVLDGDAAMGPHWPTIVHDYIHKIVRHLCGNSRSGQGINTAVCEIGLVMYNANSDSGIDMQFINWTSEVDEFLNGLRYLAFNGDGFNASGMAEALAEALLMYSKPSNGTLTREYFNGEKHCILVAASHPFTGKMIMALPKIGEAEFVGTEVEICRVDYRHVARMFTPLAISFSLISPKKHPIWREIFNLGNNILGIAGTDPDSSFRFTTLISENLKGAFVDPKEITTNVTVPVYSIINNNDSENWSWEGQIAMQTTTVAQQSNGYFQGLDQSIISLLESVPFVTQNENASDQTQIASTSTNSPMSMHDINAIIFELKNNTDYVLQWNKPTSCITIEDHDDPSEHFNPNIPLMNPSDDIGNSLDSQQSMSTGKQVSSTDSFFEFQGELEQALIGTSLYKPKGQGQGQTSFTASTFNPFEQALQGSGTLPNISGAETLITTSTDNSSKEVENNSQLVEPKAPNTSYWSEMVKTLGGNSFIDIQNSALLSSSSSESSTGLQANNEGVQITSGAMNSNSNDIFQGTNNEGLPKIIPTRGVFSLVDAMKISGNKNTDTTVQESTDAQNTQIQMPFENALNGSIASNTVSNSFIDPSSLGNQTSILSGILGQKLAGHKRDLPSAFDSLSPAARSNYTFLLTAGMPPRNHLPFPEVPMEVQPDYVLAWQGAISGILQNSTICYNEVRVYRKKASRETLTVQWPRWLQINRTIRQSIVSNSLRSYRGPVDYVIVEILRCNSHHLHDCLRGKDFCAKLLLPSQTLLLTPTNQPFRFIGTILQGRHDFTTLHFTYASSSRAGAAKSARLMK